MSYKFLHLSNQTSADSRVWLLTIQRPESLNALHAGLLSELRQALQQVAAMPFSQARVLILTGAGEKAFVAGADIKELSGLTSAQGREFSLQGQKTFRHLEELKIPTIAAVNGFALGGGLELALSCDFIYASENAKLGLPEVSLGLIPGFGGTVRLARVVGLSRAKEMIFTGEILTASQAFTAGLVNRVLPPTELLAAAEKTALTIAARGPLALAAAKQMVQRAWDLEMDQALSSEAESFSNLFSGSDFIEGTSAFIDKRKANFKGE